MRTKHALTLAALVASTVPVTLLCSLPGQASHAPPLVHEKNMSEFNMGMDHVTTNEKETSVAVDPNNPNRLMAAANEAISGGRNVHEWYASSDGGRTFTRGQVPINTNLTIPGVSNAEIEYSDPWLAYGSDGTVQPSYTAVLVTNSVTKSGSTISGTKPSLVIVQTNAGYQPSPGHAGTGQVVAVLCH